MVLQQATDVEKHEQDQLVPGAAVTEFGGFISQWDFSAGAEDTNVCESFKKVKGFLDISYSILSLQFTVTTRGWSVLKQSCMVVLSVI